MPKIAAVRSVLFAVGIVALWIAGKLAYAGLGNGTFHVAMWELVVLVVVGGALIVFGWQRSTGATTDREDEPGDGIDAEDEL
ncbi:MAG: hypothetical protein WB785_22840 [Mycobacterium sp.]|uniref:hypothetical protein n=1 Tax=Mycobacterium sp. TaxID=1785 RepID=UPI003C4411C3